MRRQSQKQSKTLSTTQSLHSAFRIPVHSYHRYDSLLHYIVSFISDLKFHILELKQLVYNLVGLDLTNFSNWDTLHDEQQCEYCQVQFMISSCKKVRNDVVRLISIMRGFSKNQKQTSSATTYQQKCFLKKQIIIDENNQFQSFISPYLDSNHRTELNLSQVNGFNSNLILDDIGFLTFREIQTRSKSNSKIKNEEFMRIIQENIQTSRAHQEKIKEIEDSLIPNLSQITYNFKRDQAVVPTNQCQIIFHKAISLINLIRAETNQKVNNLTDQHQKNYSSTKQAYSKILQIASLQN